MGNTVHSRRGNLPAGLAGFVGREAELTEIAELVRGQRLVTLTGVAGVGKTRTALQVAEQVTDRFPDGVWLVRLGPLRDGSLLPHVICREMRLQDQTTRPMVEVLTDRLAGNRCLLVLDGCEHLLEPCALIAAVLLAVAPGVHLLCTSRQPLGVRGEHGYTLNPLPPRGDAIRLFTGRATAADPRFVSDEKTAPSIQRICERLEGIPLALELAAALLPDLAVDELADRIDDRFATLAGRPSATGPAHHTTLWNAIGWSHELCQPRERLLWARLSIFAGGYTLDTVRDVCSGGPLEDADIAPTLAALVDKSLVRRDGDRYTMLDTVREFGAYWLNELGEDRRLRLLHRDHYLADARHSFDEWLSDRQLHWSRHFAREYPDLRVALETCFTEPGPAALELLGALWFFWYCCGHQREGRVFFERALAHDASPGYFRMRAAWAYGLVVLAQGDVPASDHAAEMCQAAAVGTDRGPDGPAAHAAAYLTGTGASITGRAAEAVAITSPFGRVLRPAGGMLEATSLMIQACLSYVYITQGEYAKAAEIGAWIRAEGTRRGEFKYRSWGDYVLALVGVGTGDPAAAAEHARASLEANRQLGDAWGMALVLDVLAGVLIATGEADEAARMLGMGEQMWRATFGPSQLNAPELAAARRQSEQAIRAAIGDEPYHRLFTEGLELNLSETIL